MRNNDTIKPRNAPKVKQYFAIKCFTKNQNKIKPLTTLTFFGFFVAYPAIRSHTLLSHRPQPSPPHPSQRLDTASVRAMPPLLPNFAIIQTQ